MQLAVRRPRIKVVPRYMLNPRRLRGPALIVYLYGRRPRKLECPEGVDVIYWNVTDRGYSGLITPVVSLVRKLVGSSPREEPAADFLLRLYMALSRKRYREIVVSCAMGVSRSPAVAMFIAELVGSRAQMLSIRRRHPFYNRRILAMLRREKRRLDLMLPVPRRTPTSAKSVRLSTGGAARGLSGAWEAHRCGRRT